MPNTILQFFTFSNLPEPECAAAEQVAGLAQQMEEMLPDGPEKSAGLRKLLEAKDCFVRAAMAGPKPN